jgi:GNAT superfamily N-acetyltransferase
VPVDICLAETDEDLDDVRRLFRSFLTWHRDRHTGDSDLIDAYFDEDAWEQELSGLPGAYRPPDGVLLLARDAGLALGCVAAKRLDADACEMKRMFVAPVARGHGAGRAMAEDLLIRMGAAGYRRMYLDTSIRQAEALTLYRSLGFTEVAPYYDVPDELRDWLVFLAVDL